MSSVSSFSLIQVSSKYLFVQTECPYKLSWNNLNRILFNTWIKYFLLEFVYETSLYFLFFVSLIQRVLQTCMSWHPDTFFQQGTLVYLGYWNSDRTANVRWLLSKYFRCLLLLKIHLKLDASVLFWLGVKTSAQFIWNSVDFVTEIEF